MKYLYMAILIPIFCGIVAFSVCANNVRGENMNINENCIEIYYLIGETFIKTESKITIHSSQAVTRAKGLTFLGKPRFSDYFDTTVFYNEDIKQVVVLCQNRYLIVFYGEKTLTFADAIKVKNKVLNFPQQSNEKFNQLSEVIMQKQYNDLINLLGNPDFSLGSGLPRAYWLIGDNKVLFVHTKFGTPELSDVQNDSVIRDILYMTVSSEDKVSPMGITEKKCSIIEY